MRITIGSSWGHAISLFRWIRFVPRRDVPIGVRRESAGMYAKLTAFAGSIVLSALGLLWLLRADDNPLDQDRAFSAALTPFPDGWTNGIFFGCALVALAAAVALFRSAQAAPWVACAGIVALLVLMDSSALTAAGYLPVVMIGAAIGEVSLGVYWSLGLLLQLTLLMTVAAFGWVVARRFRREHDEIPAHERAARLASATARTRRWTAIAIEAPLVYALTRVLMFFQVPGFDLAEFNAPILWAGLGLALAATGGAWLTFGLVRPWGEVFPRWLVGLRGRPVPVGFAVAPGLLVAVMILTASKSLVTSFEMETLLAWPLVALPMLLWPLWAIALAAATLNYAARRRIAPVSIQSGRSEFEKALTQRG